MERRVRKEIVVRLEGREIQEKVVKKEPKESQVLQGHRELKAQRVPLDPRD